MKLLIFGHAVEEVGAHRRPPRASAPVASSATPARQAVKARRSAWRPAPACRAPRTDRRRAASCALSRRARAAQHACRRSPARRAAAPPASAARRARLLARRRRRIGVQQRRQRLERLAARAHHVRLPRLARLRLSAGTRPARTKRRLADARRADTPISGRSRMRFTIAAISRDAAEEAVRVGLLERAQARVRALVDLRARASGGPAGTARARASSALASGKR